MEDGASCDRTRPLSGTDVTTERTQEEPWLEDKDQAGRWSVSMIYSRWTASVERLNSSPLLMRGRGDGGTAGRVCEVRGWLWFGAAGRSSSWNPSNQTPAEAGLKAIVPR